jgi:hypothetical protein
MGEDSDILNLTRTSFTLVPQLVPKRRYAWLGPSFKDV